MLYFSTDRRQLLLLIEEGDVLQERHIESSWRAVPFLPKQQGQARTGTGRSMGPGAAVVNGSVPALHPELLVPRIFLMSATGLLGASSVRQLPSEVDSSG